MGKEVADIGIEKMQCRSDLFSICKQSICKDLFSADITRAAFLQPPPCCIRELPSIDLLEQVNPKK